MVQPPHAGATARAAATGRVHDDAAVAAPVEVEAHVGAAAVRVVDQEHLARESPAARDAGQVGLRLLMGRGLMGVGSAGTQALSVGRRKGEKSYTPGRSPRWRSGAPPRPAGSTPPRRARAAG